MICENCGSEVADNTIYCVFCGSNLKMQYKPWRNAAESSPEQSNIFSVSQDLKGSKPNSISYSTAQSFDKALLNQYITISAKLQDLDKLEKAYQLHNQHVRELQNMQQNAQNQFNLAHQQTQKEWKDIERLRKLSWTSIKARVGGTKEFQLQKEETDYLAAQTREENARRDLENISVKLQVAFKELKEMEAMLQSKSVLTSQLEDIIHRACATVTDPEETQVEQDIKRLEQTIQPLASHRQIFKNGLNHFQNAWQLFSQALQLLGGAKSFSDWDTFFGGGFMVDMMKHSKVTDAQDLVRQANRELNSAYSYLPHAPRISPAVVKEMNQFWDVFFDNIFSDFAAREKIKQSQYSVEQSTRELMGVIQWVEREMAGLEQQYQNLERQLKDKKVQLIAVRKRMIEQAIQNR
jgi:hypothetical protein